MATDPNKAASAAAGTVTENVDEFGALLLKEFKPRSDEAKTRIEGAVRTLAEQALEGTNVVSGDVIGTIGSMIAALDAKLSEQVNAIIHHPEFQALESAWRGLNHLVMNTESDKEMKIRVMNNWRYPWAIRLEAHC